MLKLTSKTLAIAAITLFAAVANAQDNNALLELLVKKKVLTPKEAESVSLFYNLTDFATFGVSYYYAWNLRDNLIGGFATAGPGGGIADANAVQVLQLDLNVKF